MTDWADEQAEEILSKVRETASHKEAAVYIAEKLREVALDWYNKGHGHAL